jgi:hypothetical protein
MLKIGLIFISRLLLFSFFLLFSLNKLDGKTETPELHFSIPRRLFAFTLNFLVAEITAVTPASDNTVSLTGANPAAF